MARRVSPPLGGAVRSPRRISARAADEAQSRQRQQRLTQPLIRAPPPGRPRVSATSTIVDLDQDPRVIIGSRVINAPRDLVWQVWTDPKHLGQWWGPDGFTTTTNSFDMRPGGMWRFVMHGPDGRDYENRVTF